MSGVGKPLHFLGWVLGGWVVLRIGVIAMPMFAPRPDALKETSFEHEREKPMVAAKTDQRDSSQPVQLASARNGGALLSASFARQPDPGRAFVASINASTGDETPPVQVPIGAPQRSALPNTVQRPAPELAISTPPAVAKNVSRWSLTSWVLWRPDTGASLAQGPLLGGSQGGLRLDYRLWGKGPRSLSLYGRLTRAVERPFAEEVALGVALRPVEGVPVSLMAERRQKLGAGARNGFAFLAAGGVGPKPVAPRLDVEGYAQAGVVIAPDSAGFADGKLALDYRLTSKTATDLAIGIGVSGGAQAGAARLDIGPELRLRLPVAGGHVRFSAEWRQRIAGTARPASGPAIALVSDF